MVSSTYVHGYRAREAERLNDQANTLVELLHSDTHYAAGTEVLEVGCGVGAQSVTLARRSPEARFTCVDISAGSIWEARATAAAVGLGNLQFQQADLFALPFEALAFDHAFVCFVLEHLARPVDALRSIARLLRPGGTITVIEGDHGSILFHPESVSARRVIDCQVALQRHAGSNAMVGRELHPLLIAAGVTGVHVSPRLIYVDGSRPDLADGFTRKTFTAMIEGIRSEVLGAGLIDADAFDRGLQDLRRTAEPDGVFCYTFFKAVGRVT